MNKIYKVIWSKVKHQYVVVSELAHSNGKQSRTARKSLRSRIAALVVSGAVAAFGVFGVLPMQQALAESIPMGTGMTQESNNNDVTIVIEGEMKSEEDGSFVFSEDLMDKPWGVMELAGEHINFSSDGGTAGNDKRIVISAMEKIGYAKDENGNVIFENGEGKLAYWDLKDNTLKYCGTNEIVNDEDEQGFAPQIKPEYMSKYLDVGSVVRGNIDKPKDVKADKGNLTSLSINGDYYNVTDYALQDGQVAVGETETIYDKDGKSNPVEVQTGATFLKVADRNDPTKSDDVKVDGLVTYNTREDNKGNVTTDYGNITLAGYVEKDENGNIKYDEKGHPIRQGTLITNVKDGTIWKDSKDAVNGSQLYAVDQKVNAGWTAKVGETSINVRPNLENETGKDVLNFEAGDNIKLTPNADENKIKIAADGVVSYDKNTSGGYDTTSVTLGEEGNKYVPVSDDGKTPASGGVKLTNVAYASGNDKSEAVNVDYLEKYVDKNGGGSWNITANKNDENATSIGKGNTVDFSGDDNITVAKTDKADKSGADITVNLNDNITLGEGENQIQLNGAPKDDDTPAISVGNNFAVNHDGSITSTVANNAGGGAKADATFNFDEHGLSVKDNVGKTSTLIDGGTITVRNALDNQTVINGKAITAGDIKLNSENNASTMVGLSNTTWENNETWQNEHVVDNRAATEGQLKQAINNLETSTTGNEKHIATAADGEAHPQGGYTVDKEDHTVTLTEVDGNGKATGNNVVISGIASSDEVGDLNYSKVVNEGDDLTINDDDSVTLAIGKLDDRVINNTNNITKLQGQTIDGGYVEDGVINLTHKNDDNTTKTVAQIDGLKDYTLQNGQFITKAKDENGKFTGATELTIADRYDPTKTEKVTIDGLVTYNTTQKLDETTGETIVTGIDYDNIRLAGENGTRITNLVDGWVDKKSTDAVNGSQLASVKDGAVKYWQNEDGSYDKSFVQLEGGEDGTLVTHVRDGAVNEYSSDAVNGSQLWETQQQIEEVQTEAGKHTTVTVNGGMTAPEDGSYTHDENGKLDGNLLLKQTNNDGQIEYDLKLNPDLTLQGEDGSTARVEIGGTNGTIMATKDPNSMAATTTIDGGNIYAGSSITVGTPNENEIVITNKDITGLSNTNWDGTTDNVSRAATEGQLQTVSKDVASLNDGTVKYWKNEDGSYDKSFVQLEGGEEGTTITHLKDGVVAEYSTEAINGSQLWETQQQIKDVETTANKHTIVSTTDDSNLTVKNVAKEGEADNYQVTLNDEVVLGDYFDKGNGVLISGNSGTISATNSITVGEDQGLVIDGQKKTIQGLSNTTWTGTTETPNRAATEGQLQNAYDGSVKYWRNEDGTYDKSFIQLEGGEEGTTITHLKDGVVAEYSTEAINGSQLWETQQQIKDVETTANKHTIVSTTKDSNLTVKNVAGEGEADNYQVALKDDITLKGDSSSIELTGTKGTIQVNQETAEGTNFTNINGNVVSIGYTNSEGIENAIVIDGGKGTITGLSNTTWDDELATQVANSEELQGTAATQGQLQQAVSAVATEAAKQHTTVSGDDNLTVKSSVNENGGTNYQVTLDDDITLGNPKAGNTEGERSFTINTTDPEGYVPKSYETGSGADFIKENGGFMLFATDTQGYGVFGVTAKGSAWAKDFKTYTTDIYGNNTQYSLNEIGDAVAQMSSYYNKENGKSYTVFSRYLNEAEKDNPFATVDENATRDIPLALRDDGTVLIGATIKGDDFIDNGIRINAEIDDDGNNVATITGLENTTWTPPAPVATFANEGTETSRAATEAQLNDLYSTVVGYNVDTNGVNYGTVTLGGGRTSYDQDTHEGGTVLNNVAYASGTDGSEAVNVDYLKDTINKAVEAGGSISNSDKHLVANTAEGSNGVYKPNAEGNVNLIVSDEKGNSSTVTIGDVASKTELDSLKTNVGDLNYDKVTGDKLVNGDSVTTAIGKLDNKIENISGTATDAANNTVTGGTIKDDGTISLTQKDGGTVALDGKLTDSGVVQDGTKFDGETGTITITSQDKYSGKTSSVKVEGIASTEVVGATNKEDLATAYKDADKDGNATTEYITDSESMVEADVALDHAIQDVANTGYANDMVLSNRIDSVEKRLGNVEERIDKVGAMAAAIANLRTMGFDPEAPTEIAIGVGQYKSETGIAIGVFHYPNQDFMLSASLSSSGDELMGGIGATWKLGRKSAAERAKDEEARHLEQAEEMKKLAQQEKVKAQAQRHAKLLAERQQASQKNA